MRKIKEVLRLHFEANLSQRQIAKTCGMSRPTVGEYLRRAAGAGLSWPLPEGLDDGELERRLFPPLSTVPSAQRPQPIWSAINKALRGDGVTLFLLWDEYKAACPEGFQYSYFCQQYRAWRGQLDVVMRQEHRAGEKLFVDYAGHTMPIIDRRTGEARQAQIFVAVMGASNYTFAEATWSQQLPDWIGSHVRALRFLGGVPEIVVPDNLRSAVNKAHRYEPDINPTYAEWARHYGVAVIPARPRRPRDKAKAEAGVLLVERWILARLRHQQFFSLAALNAAIAKLLEDLNNRPFKKLPGSRREWFESLDQPVLKPLPQAPYVYAQWSHARVNIDYHVAVDGHYYSAPYQLIKKQLDVCLSAGTVELFHRSKRVASHCRSFLKGRHTTVAEHMPKAHRDYAQWTPERLIRWARSNGPATAHLVQSILDSRAHPQQGFRSVLGILRLGKGYSEARLEAACTRAIRLGALSYKSIESILKNGLDLQPLPEPTDDTPAIEHRNIRGAGYYH
ncbi:MAG: IS21 family transposase [Planctomycetes bacterium]|nr:IS21 family transposase [Planctomycetota bacterium]